MSQVITGYYHYSDEEDTNFKTEVVAIGQREINGESVLWDSTHDVQVPWNKSEGICSSIDRYLNNINEKTDHPQRRKS